MQLTHGGAVRVDGDPVPSYVARAIEQVEAVGTAELVAVIVDPSGSEGPRPRADRWYDAVERRIFRGGPGALDAVPLSGAPAAVRRAAPGAAAWDVVRERRADLLLDLAARSLPAADAHSLPAAGGTAAGPSPGHWRLRFAAGLDGPRHGAVPRLAAGDGLGVAVLEGLLGDGAVADLAWHVGALPAVGHVRNRDALLWAAANLPARALRRGGRIAAAATPELDGAGSVRDAGPVRDAGSVRPGWLRLAGVTARRIAERVVYREEWQVLTRARDPQADPPGDLRGFREVPAPPGRFYADPFLLADDTGVRLFVEVSGSGRHEGSIVALPLAPDGTWGPAEPVLSLGRHLAYPHVVAIGGGPVLTPDDGTGRVVVAYRPGPDRGPWQPAATILSGVRAADPTLLEHDGRLWLFVTEVAHGMSPWDDLHLYSAPSLDGPWEPHPGNPIVADVRRARSAGRILRHGGRLVRPSQDCAAAYGRRVVLNEITRLDREAYEERTIGTIEPTGTPGARRTHSYSTDGGMEAVDALVRRHRLSPLGARRGRVRPVPPVRA